MVNKNDKNEWAYDQFDMYCFGAGIIYYQIRPGYALGGPFYSSATPQTWCAYSVRYPRGQSFWRDSGAE